MQTSTATIHASGQMYAHQTYGRVPLYLRCKLIQLPGLPSKNVTIAGDLSEFAGVLPVLAGD